MTDGTGFIANFHFLRPWFLLALPLGLAFLYLLRHRLAGQSSWSEVIDPQLLRHLIDQPQQAEKRHWPIVSLLAGWIIACLAMAGPAWERTPQEVVQNRNAFILILDLSLSMYAEDQKPSRLINAKHKIADLMATRKDGLTALIVYSGDAHIVAPMTDDNDTINTLLPALEPNMMPKFGTNLGNALQQAEQLLHSSGLKQAEVVLFTDEITPAQFPLLATLQDKNLHLSIFTFGTPSGAPIPLNKGFLKDRNDNTVLAKLNWDDISAFARRENLLAMQSTIDDQDISLLLRNATHGDEHQRSERQFDLWQDNGHWLTLLLIPLLLAGFRRGWILVLLVMVGMPDNSYAMSWDDLWQTSDQQAAAALQHGDTKTAAEKFVHPQWKASAEYKNGNYEAALQGFSADTSAENLYNKGNTLAKMGQLDDAIKAYDAALQQQPGMQDASANKALVEKLREQQKQQQQNQDQQNNDQKNQDNKQDNKNSADKQQDQQQGDQQHKDQNGQQQNQDQNQQNAGQQNQNKTSADNNQQQDKPQNQNNASAANDDKDKQQQQNPASPQDNQDKKDDNKNATASAADKKNDSKNNKDTMQAAQQNTSMTPLEKEQQQALQQWLRKIPDDPGQLLRNKFRYQYEVNRQHNEHIDKDSEQLW